MDLHTPESLELQGVTSESRLSSRQRRAPSSNGSKPPSCKMLRFSKTAAIAAILALVACALVDAAPVEMSSLSERATEGCWNLPVVSFSLERRWTPVPLQTPRIPLFGHQAFGFTFGWTHIRYGNIVSGDRTFLWLAESRRLRGPTLVDLAAIIRILTFSVLLL